MSAVEPSLCKATASRRKSSQVLRVTVFRRKGSRYWQARVWIKGKLVRITTRTQNRAAAEEFAVLAWRHFAGGGARIGTGRSGDGETRGTSRTTHIWNLNNSL